MANLNEKQPLSSEEKRLVSLWREGGSVREFCQLTGLSKYKADKLLEKAGVAPNFDLTPEKEAEVIRLKTVDPHMKHREIAERVGLKKDTVAEIVASNNLAPPKYRKGNWTRVAKVTDETKALVIKTWEKKDNPSVAEVAGELNLGKTTVRRILSGAGMAPEAKRITTEQEALILKTRENSPTMTLGEIASAVGLHTDSVKKVIQKHGAYLSPEQAQVNARAGQRPGYMEHARKHLTESTVAARSSKIKKTYASWPSWKRKAKGEMAKRWWASLTPDEYHSYMEGRRAALENSEALHSYLHRSTKGKSFEDHCSDVAKERGGEFIGPYLGSKEKTKWKCKKGHLFYTVPNAVLASGSWCPSCFTSSAGEGEMADYIASIYDGDVLRGSRGVIPPRELDVYVPELKVGFEYDGLFWHSHYNERNKDRHAQKMKMAKRAGVRLFAFFEDEWKNKNELVKLMIAQRLGAFPGQKLNARQLDYKEVGVTEANDFFDVNHLAGGTKAKEAVGLYLGEQLVACASFRANFNGEWELARMATHRNYLIRGGAGRLLSRVDRPLVSFSDNRVGDGAVYKKLGFRLVAENGPSYWYTDGQVRIWRWKCRRINDPEVLAKYPTEESQCRAGIQSMKIFGDNRPLYKIEDYGHRKWVLDK